jgi:UDP-glucose 4-epimerase
MAPVLAGQILVTGGAGFIGSHLVERLLSEGYSVVVLDDMSTGNLENLQTIRNDSKLRVVNSKISTCQELEQLVSNSHAICHLAAAVGVELVVRSPIHVLETNLHETELLLQSAARKRVPFLMTSTSEVYGKSQQPAFKEDDDLLIGSPHQARWGYACSKLMDEFLALAYAKEQDLPVTIARLFNTVGPRQTGRYGMVLPRFIAAAKEGKPLKVYGDGLQTRCFCYVADTVEALVRLLKCQDTRGNIFNIGGTEEISIRDLAQRVVKIMGSTSSIEFIPYADAYEPGFEDMRRRKPVVEKLAAATGFRPKTTLEEIIRLTAGSVVR